MFEHQASSLNNSRSTLTLACVAVLCTATFLQAKGLLNGGTLTLQVRRVGPAGRSRDPSAACPAGPCACGQGVRGRLFWCKFGFDVRSFRVKDLRVS